MKPKLTVLTLRNSLRR